MEHNCTNHSDTLRRLGHNEDNIASLFRTTNGLLITQAEILVKLESLIKSMEELKTQVEEIKNTPSKRWETVVSTIMTALISGGIGVGLSFLLR